VAVVVVGLLVYLKKHKRPYKFTFNEEYPKKVLEEKGFLIVQAHPSEPPFFYSIEK